MDAVPPPPPDPTSPMTPFPSSTMRKLESSAASAAETIMSSSISASSLSTEAAGPIPPFNASDPPLMDMRRSPSASSDSTARGMSPWTELSNDDELGMSPPPPLPTLPASRSRPSKSYGSPPPTKRLLPPKSSSSQFPPEGGIGGPYRSTTLPLATSRKEEEADVAAPSVGTALEDDELFAAAPDTAEMYSNTAFGGCCGEPLPGGMATEYQAPGRAVAVRNRSPAFSRLSSTCRPAECQVA
mmetsp:Transcript_8781/g.26279  ORF Transcript_8781/g.26279 Transcript_8781/m.26279 type:complete len:242 (-) Transcript_8781:26-751(-)